MRNSFLTIIMVMLLGCTTATFAQQTNKKAQQPQVTDVVSAADTAAIEAYSDTTSAPVAVDTAAINNAPINMDWDEEEIAWKFFNDNKGWAMALAIIIILALLLISLAPFIILGFIIYLIVKNRRMRSELREKETVSAQDEQAVHATQAPRDTAYTTVSDTYMDKQNQAIKNIFLGIGIVIALNIFGMDKLAGIGWIVVCWGIGQFIIARNSRKRIPEEPKEKDTHTRSTDDDYVEVKE
ncbi:MAG: hypothetical protein IJ166_09075 [Prevotella sp.]|nr:hypothetical protein [Prevotella sp.]MBQ9223861.1 hypothetical protein [Prevotella sp.]